MARLRLAPPVRPATPGPQPLILHVDLDSFFVSVERVLDPRLDGRPVIVGGSPASRGVVTSASLEAREQGVHAGMASAVARRLCPDATFLPGRGRIYGQVSAAAMKVLHEYSPAVERASIDEAYLAVEALERSADAAIDVAGAIQRSLSDRLGLPSSVGIGRNKLIAKVACGRAKPQGILEVWPGYEEAFLGPLPVEEIPGVGPVLAGQLRLFGLTTAAEVARVAPELLAGHFGAAGLALARKARGLGEDRLAPVGLPKSLSRERTFAEDVTRPGELEQAVGHLAVEVGRRVRAHGLAGRTVGLKLRTAEFATLTRSRTLPAATDDDGDLAAHAVDLLRSALPSPRPLRLVGVSLSGLARGAVQRELFPDLVSGPRIRGGDGAGRGFPWASLVPPELGRSAVRATGSWTLLPGRGAVVHGADGRLDDPS